MHKQVLSIESSLQGVCNKLLAIIFTVTVSLCLYKHHSNTREAQLGLGSSQMVPFKTATVIVTILQLDAAACHFQSSPIFQSPS